MQKKTVILLKEYHDSLPAKKQKELKGLIADDLGVHQGTVYSWLAEKYYPTERRAIKIQASIESFKKSQNH